MSHPPNPGAVCVQAIAALRAALVRFQSQQKDRWLVRHAQILQVRAAIHPLLAQRSLALALIAVLRDQYLASCTAPAGADGGESHYADEVITLGRWSKTTRNKAVSEQATAEAAKVSNVESSANKTSAATRDRSSAAEQSLGAYPPSVRLSANMSQAPATPRLSGRSSLSVSGELPIQSIISDSGWSSAASEPSPASIRPSAASQPFKSVVRSGHGTSLTLTPLSLTDSEASESAVDCHTHASAIAHALTRVVTDTETTDTALCPTASLVSSCSGSELSPPCSSHSSCGETSQVDAGTSTRLGAKDADPSYPSRNTTVLAHKPPGTAKWGAVRGRANQGDGALLALDVGGRLADTGDPDTGSVASTSSAATSTSSARSNSVGGPISICRNSSGCDSHVSESARQPADAAAMSQGCDWEQVAPKHKHKHKQSKQPLAQPMQPAMTTSQDLVQPLAWKPQHDNRDVPVTACFANTAASAAGVGWSTATNRELASLPVWPIGSTACHYGGSTWLVCGKFGKVRCRSGNACVHEWCGFAHPAGWTHSPLKVGSYANTRKTQISYATAGTPVAVSVADSAPAPTVSKQSPPISTAAITAMKRAAAAAAARQAAVATKDIAVTEAVGADKPTTDADHGSPAEPAAAMGLRPYSTKPNDAVAIAKQSTDRAVGMNPNPSSSRTARTPPAPQYATPYAAQLQQRYAAHEVVMQQQCAAYAAAAHYPPVVPQSTTHRPPARQETQLQTTARQPAPQPVWQRTASRTTPDLTACAQPPLAQLAPQCAAGVPIFDAQIATAVGRARAQIEYYFSDANLSRDRYLRCLMDAEGWVPVLLLNTFPKVAREGLDVCDIVLELRASRAVTVSGTDVPAGQALVRRTRDYERWPLQGATFFSTECNTVIARPDEAAESSPGELDANETMRDMPYREAFC